MFKSRSAASGAPDAAQASIEVIRLRARQRLIGAVVLVGIGVIGFPLVFDTAPRPMSADVVVEIPARQLRTPETPVRSPAAAKAAPSASATSPEQANAGTQVAARDSLDSTEEIVSAAPAAKPAAPAPKPAAVPVKPSPVAAKPDTPAAAPANLPTTNARIVVQVGAFSDPAKAREARLKLERAGIKTYTNVAKTPQGERIRVRVGPFSTKVEADKAAAKAKALGLEAGLYWL
jgi:DedD protein